MRRRKGKKRYIITLILLLILIGMGKISYDAGVLRTKIDYANSLDEIGATVNGKSLSLRELAYYVAYEEEIVQKQALAYNPDNPKEYWNLHTNFNYIRVVARDAAINMAIHDEIFYQMACEEGIELNESETEALTASIEDFWMDMYDFGKDKRIGVTKEDIADTMEHVAYAQKMQLIYANIKNCEYEDYDYTGEGYEEMLSENTYKINGKVWPRVYFGNVTIRNEKTQKKEE